MIDAGCELDGYASDITRTFPVNGKYSGPQRAVYDIVLAAQEAAIAVTKVGFDFQAPHDAALKILTQGLLDLNLIDKKAIGGLDNAIEKKAYQRFYMHRTSDWFCACKSVDRLLSLWRYQVRRWLFYQSDLNQANLE